MNIMPSSIALPCRVVSRRGAVNDLARVCGIHGKRGLIVRGRSMRARNLPALFEAEPGSGFEVMDLEHPGGEPTLDDARAALAAARKHKAGWIAGIGGGSVLDIAKTAAGLFYEDRDLAVFHDGAEPARPGVPFIAVPTTAGTGTEATINAVLTDTGTCVKKSIRSESLMAAAVILDPGLLAGTPARVLAHSGMDALTQAVEAYTSRNAVKLSDALCLQALELITGGIEDFIRNPAGPHAESMLTGSFFAGLGLAMARLGVVHGIAHPLGALYSVPHGLVCAVCLPVALQLNKPHIKAKYAEMSRIAGMDFSGFVACLLDRLGIESPFRGLEPKERGRIVSETLASGSTRANPKPMTERDVGVMLDVLFGPGT